MKKINQIILPLCLLFALFGCGKGFLETTPKAQITEDQLLTTNAVNSALIGAYGLVNGNINGTWGNYSSAPSQWLFGEVAADDAHKGSSNADQSPMNDIELHKVIPSNDNLPTMWTNYYEGIIRCNLTLKLLTALQATDQNDKFTDDEAKLIEAQAKFLRGHYYFFLTRVFGNEIPYIDESITETAEAAKVANDVDITPKIEADFQFAVTNLTFDKPNGEAGRVDKYAAESYLGKLYLYEKKYSEALTLFKDVITRKPALGTIAFTDNFDVNKENGPGSIFAAQHIINPDGSGDNGNVGDMLSGLYGTAPISCCGFFQPSVDLVNAYRTGTDGLPLSVTAYRTDPYVSDLGLSGAAKENYKVDQTLRVDPRLDYTVGRRGVPYKDWGIFPGDAWIREAAFGGPFVSKKQMIDKADFGGNTVSGTEEITSLNVNIIRLADVYLMAAECAAQTGDLGYALERVNDVRNRAAALPSLKIDGADAAKYLIKPYPSFASKDYAMSAIETERRLELALEGHRFYDLVRWGLAKSVIESYQNFEKSYVSASQTITFEDKDEIFPIPQEQIDRSGGVLQQNVAGK